MRRVEPLKPEATDLAGAAGLVLAEDIVADRDQPPADRSAMDGYAVRSADVPRQPRTLKLIGEAPAGAANCPAVAPRTCVEIFTGANIPKGADAVVPVEQTQRDGDSVRFLLAAKPGMNIRRRGEEAAAGQVLLRAGAVVGPAQAGICAMAGRARPLVYPQPRSAILVTGAEVKDASEMPTDNELRDSNGPALQAAFARWSLPWPARRIVPDDPAALAKEIKAAAQNDVVIITGGVSVGKYDYVTAALEKIGATIHFHGVAMKPGKPQLYATLNDNLHIFGLPGNPLSVLTGFHEFALPAIRRLSGWPGETCRVRLRASLDADIKIKADRTSYIIAGLAWTPGGITVSPVRSAGSADIAAAAQADGVIIVPAGICEISRGDLALFCPWRPLP